MSPEQVAYQTAHIHEDRRPNILAATSSLTVLSTLAIFLRVYVRWSTRAGLRADDYTIFAAGVSVIQTLLRLDLELEIDSQLAHVCVHLLRYISPSSFSREDC